MKTVITIEPMSENSMFASALRGKYGTEFNPKNCFEMFVTTEHPTNPNIKTITNFPILPSENPEIIRLINFGLDFTRKKMVDYMERNSK